MPKDHVSMHDQTGDLNRRESERTELEPMLAKVVCQTGEYLCFVRDVSTLGAGLTFMHAVPPEERILLQLANGLTYPIERVWIGKRQAGYRFGCEVTIEEFTRPQFGEAEDGLAPRPIRLEIEADAKVGDGRQAAQVRLLNLSCEGARFECEVDFQLNALIGFSLEGLEKRIGQLRWRDGHTFGMQFQHRLTDQEIADCALMLQPFGSPYPDQLAGALDKARAA